MVLFKKKITSLFRCDSLNPARDNLIQSIKEIRCFRIFNWYYQLIHLLYNVLPFLSMVLLGLLLTLCWLAEFNIHSNDVLGIQIFTNVNKMFIQRFPAKFKISAADRLHKTSVDSLKGNGIPLICHNLGTCLTNKIIHDLGQIGRASCRERV